MGLKVSKIVNTSKTKFFWVYILFGFLLTVASVMLMPFWKDANVDVFFANWGYSILNIIIAFILLLYLFLFLIKKVNAKSNKVIKMLTIIEFVLFMVIAVGLILSQFNIVPINEPSHILGLALWVRGAIEIFDAYYYDKNSEKKYSIFRLIFALILVSVGVFFIARNTITRRLILWILTILLCACSLFACLIGFIKKPKKVKSKKSNEEKVEEKTKEPKEEEAKEEK